MKILVLANLYPPHHGGTYDFRCETTTNALRTRGHTIHVLTSRHGMTAEQRGGEVERRLLLNRFLDHPLVARFGELRTLELQNHLALREAIADFQPDLIHVYSLAGLSKSLIFSLRHARLPTVYDVTDDWLAAGLRADPWLRFWNRPKSPPLQGLLRAGLELVGQRNRLDAMAPTRMMKGYERLPQVYGEAGSVTGVAPNSIPAFRFDRLYFCSRSLKEATERAGFRVSHAEVIHPGISTQLYVGEVKPASALVAKLLIVTRLETRSGVMTAVKALLAARNSGMKASLSIYGRGDSDYVAQLRSYIAMNSLPVEFLPVSNIHRDLPSVYRRHDALVHTTEWDEPFSPMPLEAMACGLPVIGTNLGGISEVFRHGENALTYTPGDEVELAARLQELQSQSELRCRIAEHAQQEVLSKYNESAVTDNIENYLQTSLEVWSHAAG